ncbi:hypothetical protein [Streptomyces mirabilis]|uniref:hypothetical protein n=1 Tax=Streptomyces mirabilis TaxID=68239 RepID=UPI0036DE96F0
MEPLWKAAEEATAGLGQLAHSYRLLYDTRLPGRKAERVMRAAPGPRPPASDHVLDVIRDVERLAYWAEEAVCEWLAEPFIPYRLWWGGDPNPLTVTSLATAARKLPQALPWAGQDVLMLADRTTRTLNVVGRLLGAVGGAELTDGECPVCYSPTLITIYSPAKTMCAAPGCEYVHFTIRKEVVA